MDKIYLKAKAKINLSLDVIRKRKDGYHDLEMIMQSIDLNDNIKISTAEKGIEVICNEKFVPSGEKNIAYKAAKVLLEKSDIKKGVKIEIEKNIPVAAGLAGGSSDAASVLKGINQLFSMNLTENELTALGCQIGADVPYCIKGGTMLAEGIGDKLTRLNSLNNIYIVLVKPQVGVSTAWVYNNLNLLQISERPDTQKIIKAIQENNLQYIAKNMTNVLESVTVKRYKIIQDIKNRLVETGAMGSLMSGSGPTVFGIFEDVDKARLSLKKMQSSKWKCFLTKCL